MVASQVRGYGVWDGALAQTGTLLVASEGRAPSLLFLWVSEAQASLLRAELCAIQASAATPGTVSPHCLASACAVWGFHLICFPLTPLAPGRPAVLLPAAGAEGAAAGAPGRHAGLHPGHGRVQARLPLLQPRPQLPTGVERRPAAPPHLPSPCGPPPPRPAGTTQGQRPPERVPPTSLALRSVSSAPRPLPASGIHLILLSALSHTRLIRSPSAGEGEVENKPRAIFCRAIASPPRISNLRKF